MSKKPKKSTVKKVGIKKVGGGMKPFGQKRPSIAQITKNTIKS